MQGQPVTLQGSYSRRSALDRHADLVMAIVRARDVSLPPESTEPGARVIAWRGRTADDVMTCHALQHPRSYWKPSVTRVSYRSGLSLEILTSFKMRKLSNLTCDCFESTSSAQSPSMRLARNPKQCLVWIVADRGSLSQNPAASSQNAAADRHLWAAK